jgi:lysophospholipid acyltransferase (LPLAT)-like uncharacterized protein
MRRDWRAVLLAPIVAAVLRLMHATLRVRHIRGRIMDDLHAAGRHYVIAFWHSHLMMMLFCRYQRPIMVLTSRHRDGALMTEAYCWFGVDSAQGSSTRGAASALREIVRAGKRGSNVALTPDGPRGPARVAKPGVVMAAQATGFPIVPVAFIGKKKGCSAPGIASRFRTPLPVPCFFTASPSTCRAI